MAEELHLTQGATRQRTYQELLPQIEALISDEEDLIANLGNIAAVLKEAFNFFWVGFYLVKDEQLVLGPFQGPLACTRINKGKGVCGKSWQEARTILVDDVDQFPGHIACSSASQSEIVIPIIKSNMVFGVLDVDSDQLADFDDTDAEGLENIIRVLEKKLD